MNAWLILAQHSGLILRGLLVTAEITVISAVPALLLGLFLFQLRLRFPLISPLVRGFIDLMRCTPFLIFLYLVYYALPGWGIELDAFNAGILALTLYNAAYFAELFSAAWAQFPREPVEAGLAFGFHGFGLFRRIILRPLIRIALPSLGNQTIQIIKDSAFLVIVTVQELTYAANEIQATYYIPFASFVVAALLYWGLCLIVEAGVRRSLRRSAQML